MPRLVSRTRRQPERRKTLSVAPITTDRTIGRFIDRFREERARLPGGEAFRERAIEHFARAGVPTRRTEEWKYTDLRRLGDSDFAAPDMAAADSVTVAQIRPFIHEGLGPLAVFIEGRLAPALSDLSGLPKGLSIASFADEAKAPDAALQNALAAFESPDGSGLTALNAALAADGAVIRVGDGVEIAAPVQIVHLMPAGSSAAVFPRNVLLAGAGSAATVVETYAALGAAEGWTNAVTQVSLGQGARLRHLRLQDEDTGAWHVGLAQIRLARDAHYRGFVLATGARLSRTEIRADFEGAGAECDLSGAYLLRGRQHGDITTRLDHAYPHCASRQAFKGVLDGRARAVFQGRVYVAPDAQKTDAHQLNRNLLLSPRAQADSKPELIIHADDVKCSHGATVGDLDRDALFYLRARGIDAATAEAMLVQAFVRELLDALPEDAVRARVESRIATWLAGLAAKEAA
jgi:Fe-S cluster assembly protein SufD